MDYLNSNFDELEPRPTPKPTVLMRITDSSVPEVSLICGTHLQASKLSTNRRVKPEGTCRTYSNWKNNESPFARDSQNFVQKPMKQNNFVDARSGETNFSIEESLNCPSIRHKQNQNVGLRKHCSMANTPNNTENTRSRNNEQIQEKTTAVTFAQNESLEGPMQNNSYNTIKSILKSSLSNGSSVLPLKSDARCDFDNNSLSDFNQHRNNQRHDHFTAIRSSPISQCCHSRETNHEPETVRDLMVLVQNQNEQIKSLQCQVEKLLERQENNRGYVENFHTMRKTNEKCHSPARNFDNDLPYRNDASSSSQRTQNSRGMNVSSERSQEQQSELSSNHRTEPLINAIMEKKVSIGVMTSFEFSVQNNPFASDSNPQMNFRDCEKAVNSTSEIRRPNGPFTTKVTPGPLENISEYTESHPSSIWRQTDDNNRLLPHDKSTDFMTNKNRDEKYIEDKSDRASIYNKGKSNPVDSSVLFLNKTSQTSVIFENSRMHKDLVHEMSNEREIDSTKPVVTSSKKLPVRNKHHSNYHFDDTTQIDRSAGRDTHMKNRDCTNLRFSEKMEKETRSIPTDNTADGSFALCSSDVEIPESPLPSLDPSIHVEMREYSSEDEDEESKCAPVGWTFYKNVVGQVNKMLHSVPGSKDIVDNNKINPLTFQNDIGNKDILSSVRSATIGQLKMLGIGYAEHSQLNNDHTQKKVTFDSSYCPPMDYQANVSQPTNSINETNTSMHMRNLALKYLSDEQLAELAVSQQGRAATMKHKLFSIQGTNMSFATMNYLQRYCLVSGTQTLNADVKGHGSPTGQKKTKHVLTKQEAMAPQATGRNGTLENSLNKGTADNILDMTTLKQQPKLL